MKVILVQFSLTKFLAIPRCWYSLGWTTRPGENLGRACVGQSCCHVGMLKTYILSASVDVNKHVLMIAYVRTYATNKIECKHDRIYLHLAEGTTSKEICSNHVLQAPAENTMLALSLRAHHLAAECTTSDVSLPNHFDNFRSVWAPSLLRKEYHLQLLYSQNHCLDVFVWCTWIVIKDAIVDGSEIRLTTWDVVKPC